MNNRKKILIGIPSMDMVAAGFAASLATLTKVTGEYESSISFICSSLIYDARNKISMQAIQNEADYVMWFDSDMVFEKDTLQRLIDDIEKKGCDIVSGLYFRRTMPFTPVLFSKLDITDGKATWENYEGELSGLVPVEGFGFGCVLMRTDVIFEVFSKYTDCFSPIGKVGEDLSFCYRAKECGFKMFADLDVKCGHVGNHVITQSFYENFRGAKNEG